MIVYEYYIYYIYQHISRYVRWRHAFAGDGNEKEDEKFIFKIIKF